MQVKELMTKNVITIGRDETLSQALGKMKSNRINQLVVRDENKIIGIIELKTMITKDIDPTTIKVAKGVRKVPHISADMDIHDAAERLLSIGVRALPVMENNELKGILSESDVIKVAKDLIKDDVKLKEIMTSCIYVDKETKSSTIKNLMEDNNISRIPILEGDKVLGVVGTLELISVLEAKTDQGSKEQGQRTEDVKAGALMSDAAVFSDDDSLLKTLKTLQEKEEIVVKDGSVGIVSPKDVLELITKKEEKGVYVQIAGMQEEDIDFTAKMDSAIQDFVQKFGKMIDGIEYLFVHVEKHHKDAKRQKYSIRVRTKVPFGLFVAHAWGWQPMDVIQDAFDKLDKSLTTDIEKRRERDHKRI